MDVPGREGHGTGRTRTREMMMSSGDELSSGKLTPALDVQQVSGSGPQPQFSLELSSQLSRSPWEAQCKENTSMFWKESYKP